MVRSGGNTTARSARNRRKLPYAVVGVYAICFVGALAFTSVGGRPVTEAALGALVFTVLVFPLVWYLLKE